MAVRELRIYPDPILTRTCALVERFDAEIGRLLTDLSESMYAHKGVGLAAPQIGVALRACVVDVQQKEGKPHLIEMVNPEIIDSSEELLPFEEGCLSFPGEAELVKRSARVVVRAQDRLGNPFELTGEQLLATALQHEIDHLDGVLFIDHLSRLKRSLVSRRLKKRKDADGR